MRYMTPSENPIVNTATDNVATVTWMASHTERSDGISSLASVYQTVIARPRLSSTGVTTNRPSQRRSRRSAHAAVGEQHEHRPEHRELVHVPQRPAMHLERAQHDARDDEHGAEQGERPADAGRLARRERLVVATAGRRPSAARMPARPAPGSTAPPAPTSSRSRSRSASRAASRAGTRRAR